MDWSAIGWTAKKIFGKFLLLPLAPMIVIVIGAIVVRRHRRVGRSLVALGVAVLVACSLPVVANALAALDERGFPPLDVARELPARSAIVVLAGGVDHAARDYGGETVNADTLTRLRAAARLAVRTGLPILVTGSPASPPYHSDADLMSDVLTRDFRLPPPRWKDERSGDTADNARFSTMLLKADGIETAVLVTDVSHMRRARMAFERAGMRVVCAPTNYRGSMSLGLFSFYPNATALVQANWTLYEWLGTLWMWIH